MSYVSLRRWLRRVRGVGGKPWDLLALILAVALIAVGEGVALTQSGAHAAALIRVDRALQLAPLVLALVIGRATFRSPLRLVVVEVSWLLTAPGGTRAVFIGKLLAPPAQFAVASLLGTVVARWWLGLPLGEAWMTVLVGAIIALAVRLAAFGSYLLTVRAHAAATLRAVALVWAGVLLVAAWSNVPGRGWLALRPVTDRLVIAVLAPAVASPVWLLTLLAALLVAATLLALAARGFEDRAETTARQAAYVHAELGRSRSGQELLATQYRTGLPSLPAWSQFVGERALCYRVLAQERRIARSTLATLGVLLAIALVLRVFFPASTWVVAALTLLSAPTVAGAADGLAAELDHAHLRLAPLRPMPALLWVSAIPAARIAMLTEVVWLAAFAAPGLPLQTWIAGAVLIPLLVAQAAAAGSLAVATAAGTVTRLALGVGLSALGAAPAIAVLVTVRPLSAATLPLAAAVVTLLVATALWLSFACQCVWTTRSSRRHSRSGNIVSAKANDG